MTLDIPQNIEINIGNLLGSERDNPEYLFEYVRLVFSNPDLTAKEYQENKLLEPTINGWITRYFNNVKRIEEYNLPLVNEECRKLGKGFMENVGLTNEENWYISSVDMTDWFSHSQRNRFIFTQEWIPILNSWYEMFRPFFVSDKTEDDGKVESYYWAKSVCMYICQSLNKETARWWYETFSKSVDSDGDEWLNFGLIGFVQMTPFMPLDLVVHCFNATHESKIDAILQRNRNLQTIEDFEILRGIKEAGLDFTYFNAAELSLQLDFDYYMMNRAANPVILKKINSVMELDWDYVSRCQTVDYQFMQEYGLVKWLRNRLNSPTEFYDYLAAIIVNPLLTEANIQDLTRKIFSDIEYVDWDSDVKVLDFLPLAYVKRTFDVQGIQYDNSDNNGFYFEYNNVLLAYLSNPNIKPRRNSLGELDFNFLTGSNSEDILDCPNHPATPFYFLSTSTFTNPAFTRRDLLCFLDYWKQLMNIKRAHENSIAAHPLETNAHNCLGTTYGMITRKAREGLRLYDNHDSFEYQGYILTGLFYAENLKVQDLVKYLLWEKRYDTTDGLDDEGDERPTNPLYQFYFLANPNIFTGSTVGLFNWWGSVVR